MKRLPFVSAENANKCQFGNRKVRYNGLEEKAKQRQTLFALANLY